MISLCNETLASLPASILVPGYDRRTLRAGIAHIGVGNFHRTHQAVFIDRCLHLPDQTHWSIIGIGLGDSAAARAKAQAFKRQHGLYTVTEYAPDGTSQPRVIGAMIDYLHAPSEAAAVAAALSSPEIKIVSLTITEGGYNFDEATGRFMVESPDIAHDLNGHVPRTAFGLIAKALQDRREAGTPPFAIVSCDNLPHNGDTLRRAVLAFAEAYNSELAKWIAQNVAFPNSMVDRIAPRVSVEAAAKIECNSKVRDLVPTISETFIQWVIEDDFPQGRPALDQVGVEFRDDVTAFVNVKGRMLNASHILMTYPAVLCGYRLVDEAMRDPDIAALLESFMEQDAIPILEGPNGLSLRAYKDSLLARFTNPALGDRLLRIAQDGATKIPVFHFETLSTMLERRMDIRREGFLLACFTRYFLGRYDLGQSYIVDEPSTSTEDRVILKAEDGLGMLRVKAFKSLNLCEHPEFVSAYLEFFTMISRDGVRRTLPSVHGATSTTA